MKKELTDKLVQDYPILFSASVRPSCGSGWFDIIDGLCDIITHHIQYAIPEDIKSQVTIAQIKEKFGGLRFYMNHEDDFINGAITFAEYQSNKICERCGKAGTKKNIGGWISTLCDEDEKLRHEEVYQSRMKYEEKQREKKSSTPK